MKIAIGCDHGAYDMKEMLKKYLQDRGHEVKDFGCFSKESCDYPDHVKPAAKAVRDGDCDRGIVLCTTGIGASIAANKVKGIRCALLNNEKCAELTRLHNDANMMALGAGYVSEDQAKSITDVFLNTPFSNEDRHSRRISKLEE